MTEALDTVISGQVTQSIRDTTLDGLEIKKDDYMGLSMVRLRSQRLNV